MTEPEYRKVKPVKLTAAADTTNQNPGNYTAALDISSVTSLAQVEGYQIAIDGPVGFGLSVFINLFKWGHTSQGWANEWDPNQAMILNPSDMVFFYFEAPATLAPVPVVYLWLRYDINFPGNQGG